jgi:hypothetical protein
VYESDKQMTLGDSDVVRAAVTLDQSTPPDKILQRTGAAQETGLVVSCRLQARLSASPDAFDVSETGWISRALLASQTQRWDWHVTPRIGGTHTLILYVRPIVKTTYHNVEEALAAESDVRDYATRVHVNVPWNKRPEEFMTRVASTLNVTTGLVKAFAALIVALGAVLTALRGLRGRRSRSTGD